MNQFNAMMPHIYWRVMRLVRQLGLLGLVGAALILANLIFFGLKYYPTKQAILVSQEQLIQTQTHSKTLSTPKMAATPSSTGNVSEFYAEFPANTQLSSALHLIQQTALKHQLAFNRGDYKLTLSNAKQTNNQGLSRYEIQLPVVGQYPQMRAFIDEIMLQLPTLALSEMQLKRENITAPTIEARLVLVIFLKGNK
ncbi:MAG: hypothetical protein WBP13_07420 [Methylophilaceae bacterium]